RGAHRRDPTGRDGDAPRSHCVAGDRPGPPAVRGARRRRLSRYLVRRSRRAASVDTASDAHGRHGRGGPGAERGAWIAHGSPARPAGGSFLEAGSHPRRAPRFPAPPGRRETGPPTRLEAQALSALAAIVDPRHRAEGLSERRILPARKRDAGCSLFVVRKFYAV